MWKVLGNRDQVNVTPTFAGQPSQMHITIETHTYNEINITILTETCRRIWNRQ